MVDEPERQPAAVAADDRRWMRDLGAMLALPSLWVDHSPAEIADGLLSVLVGVLRLEAAFARFEVPDGRERLETWRPSGPPAPDSLVEALRSGRAFSAPGGAEPNSTGFATAAVRTAEVGAATSGRITRAAALTLALPWESARVLVAASRADFPTERETHLLRVAVGQAAIALHTARRLAAERSARRAAELALDTQTRALHALLDDLAPALSEATRRVRQAAKEVEDPDVPVGAAGTHPLSAHRAEEPRVVSLRGSPLDPDQPVGGTADGTVPLDETLTRRELEVLGLLAQGLSNKEIAGVMWLSDRTVERHITSLYRKIGVGRRSEATAFALRHGVV
ncbi:response regulator transcription factor [Leifsonia sp. 1010]|uniref:helix-turn-helix transcriptional regulator n=1 Tax=Leifsonia sp. 1010 TaxID=2817769 RepID=UPI002862F027|nr:response regulator transcription factor [Leifsonia sp. 1010]MDR6613127.1 DNA-binding CsgD family transcriptional regulator [Leifsonia sp. 1010]